MSSSVVMRHQRIVFVILSFIFMVAMATVSYTDSTAVPILAMSLTPNPAAKTDTTLRPAIPTTSQTPTPSSTPTSSPSVITINGYVRNDTGNPVPSAIRVIDKDGVELGNLNTSDDGYFELTIPGRDRIIITASPFVASPQHYIEIDGGFRVSKYFEISRTILPAEDNIQVDFVLPSVAALHLEAYSTNGIKMQMSEIDSQVSPPGYPSICGVFPMDSFALPIPTGPSIGQLKPAWHEGIEYGQWEPYFAIPPGEAVYLMTLWTVPNIGTIPLRADNSGEGYNLKEGEVSSINPVYEFAETEYRRAFR